ncbi:hypothetical protein Smp_157260 [Schistosoma mansoni]|uniref:hypothetical protein n=1 Tax=Schistosoma mansoni TaxID=6183 RepID=UPI0001A61DA3|nr:hypothetical protein Smp_157260 [Schistosoma mansoni]|eukprot:XP_018645700.1 hypothetical protein Smp_157260 [Schistosoma mansoni]
MNELSLLQKITTGYSEINDHLENQLFKMEIGPNLCVWPIQSGINHELNSMQTLSPIVQQNNSFVYSRSNGVVLELESDSETELESTPHLDHHGPIESKHQENPCQSQWNNGLINLSTNDEEDYDQCIEKIGFDEYNLRNNLNVNILNNHGGLKLRIISLDPLKKSTNTYSTLNNNKVS